MLAEIENAIIQRIEGSTLGSIFKKSVGSYQDVLKAFSAGSITGMFPGAYVQYTGGKIERVAMNKYNHITSWAIIVGTKSYRSDSDRRTKATSGAYALVDSLLTLFFGQKLDLDISSFKPLGVESLASRELMRAGIAMYAVNFSTGYTIPALTGQAIQDFLEFNLRLYLQEPEADDVADLEGVIELDQ